MPKKASLCLLFLLEEAAEMRRTPKSVKLMKLGRKCKNYSSIHGRMQKFDVNVQVFYQGIVLPMQIKQQLNCTRACRSFLKKPFETWVDLKTCLWGRRDLNQ